MTNDIENFITAVTALAHSPLLIFLAVVAAVVGGAFVIITAMNAVRRG